MCDKEEVGKKNLLTTLTPKGVQCHPVNGWVHGQARPLYCHTYVPTSFTILAKVSSHSRRGFTQEYHPSHLGVVADRQSALAHFWGSIEAKRPLASAFLGRHASITLMDLN